ncbi:tetratricopeptide repeat protein [Streptomyces prunicolor]|uniref:CHAT domain-containing tetratricopeptide repeat protein n=1 Tax=Streptomyces prunicolor TaxID=67348 RepID=UPI00224E7AE0|nr:CHAT domain-containing protein [Streptomyces prunicolor]MCX5238980.1 tetratricopeptide repeat protein [Streptomyces prunicolor]
MINDPSTKRRAELRTELAVLLERTHSAWEQKPLQKRQALAPLLQRRVTKMARQLTGLLREDVDLESSLLLGWLHWYRYQARRGRRGQLELNAAVLTLTPCFVGGTDLQQLPDPLLPALADHVAPFVITLIQRTVNFPDAQTTTVAVELQQRILDVTSLNHPDRAARLSSLGTALDIRFEQIGAMTDLEEAIVILQEAVEASPTDDPKLASRLSNFANALRSRYERTGVLADLEEAVQVGRLAVEAAPADHPDRCAVRTNLAITLRLRYERTGVLADLEEAVQVGRLAVEAAPADHPDLAGLLANLAGILQIRFDRTGLLADLEEAVGLEQLTVTVARTDHPDWAAFASNLGTGLLSRFERTGVVADLNEAVRVGQLAVEAAPADHPGRAGYLSNLGNALRTRFERTGSAADLDEAIVNLQEAMAISPSDRSDHITSLVNLGIALRARFEWTGALTDLDEAVRISQHAVGATPSDHPDQAGNLSRLGNALRARFERTGLLTDLDEAITNLQSSVNATPCDHPARAALLSDLGTALQVRFRRAGVLADLDEAVRLGQLAVDTTPTDHPDHATYLSATANSLLARFEQEGVLADLDEAVRLGQLAVDTTPTDHPDHAARLSNLASALQARTVRTGALADLDQAITNLRLAVAAVPDEHPDQPGYLSNLGNALRTRYEQTETLADLDESVRAGQLAVDTTPTDHEDFPEYLSNLATALQTRSLKTENLADLDRAVLLGQQVVDATPVDRPIRANRLSNLAAAQQRRFERTGVLTDLDEAITNLRLAMAARPANHSDQAAYLCNLGNALRLKFERTGASADLDEAITNLDQATRIASASPSTRIRAARAAGDLAVQSQPVRAAELFERAVRLLPEVAPRQLKRTDQQHLLGGFAGLASDAAALALVDHGKTEQECAARALQLLEAGRAVLLSQALDTRSDLTDLQEQYPELAARFVELRGRLDQPETSAPAVLLGGAPGTPPGGQDRLEQDRHQLARDFATTLAEIRIHDRFDSFGRPPTTEELLTQADQGPVVVFNISGYRSDALLLSETGISAIPLPGLGLSALIDRINAFRQALETAAAGTTGASRREAQATLTRILEWLWDVAAGPVLTKLGYHRQPKPEATWPQVWWAPGGLLGLLPLHAAGYHTDLADDPERRTVLDRVVSSHTPSVRALRYARQRNPAPPSPARALIVAMPTTPGLSDLGRLNHVPAEVKKVHQHLTHPVLLHEPAPDRDPAVTSTSLPTKANVLAHLPTCPIAHFACHGASNPADPSKSLLLLHDHDADPLTVASLAPVLLDQAQMAYLSACRTAAIDAVELLDEAIHLTSAFQLAGFPHVIGTLWEIDDQIAVSVADVFYTQLKSAPHTLDTSRAAHALHHAIRAVRDGHGLPGDLNRIRTPSLWAAYLHAGA